MTRYARMTPTLLFAALATGIAPSCDPEAGADEDGAIAPRAAGVSGATCEAREDGPRCWGCGNSRACYDAHDYNMCLVQCEASDDAWYDLGALEYGACPAAGAAFCEVHALGDPITACWGGY